MSSKRRQFNSTLPARSAPLSRSRVKRKSKSREKWERQYGSEERVEWVSSLPCMWCGATPSENAHTTRGAGMGLKGPPEDIAPMCGVWANACHRKYDTRYPPYDDPSMRELAYIHAAHIEAAWQAHRLRSA